MDEGEEVLGEVDDSFEGILLLRDILKCPIPVVVL